MADNVYKKLQTVRKQFAENPLKKSGRNEFSKYDYFELEDFSPLAQLKFDAVGLCPVCTFPAPDKVQMIIYNSDTPEEHIVFESPFAVPNVKGMNEAQAVGAAKTYAKRYLYYDVLEISEHDHMEDPSNIPEITMLKSGIKEAIKNISSIDKELRPKISEILIKHYGSNDYNAMRMATKIKPELSSLNLIRYLRAEKLRRRRLNEQENYKRKSH